MYQIFSQTSNWSQNPLYLFPSPFSLFREIKTHKSKKIINDGGIYLMIGPVTYFLYIYLFKLHFSFIFINEEDINSSN